MPIRTSTARRFTVNTSVIDQVHVLDQIDLELRRLLDSDEQFPFWD